MRQLFSLFCLAVLIALPVHAQDALPEKRVIVTRDVDFYGADLQALFDTTLSTCQAVCLNNPDCQAFTFNTRSNACFPKSQITDRQPYDGAVSARVIQSSPQSRALAQTRVGDLGFLRKGDLSAARAQADGLAVRHGGGQYGVTALLEAAENARVQGNLADAIHWTGGATAQSDASAHWLQYAELSLRHAADLTGNDQRRYRDRAVSAAINAYLRAEDGVRANTLLILAQGFEQTGRGRDMIPALRLAETLGPRADVNAALEAAIARFGFRIVEHEVTSDSADPRICVQFSEPLIRAGTDYAPYVRLPDPRLAVEADDQQLCISGVDHGSRYTLTFRSGLPSAAGESLVRDVAITAYVRDRTPAVAFPGRAYVLARSADAGLPVETVNLDTLDLTLMRVSDRNLVRAIQDSYFGQPLSAYARDYVSNQMAETIWTGTGQVENQLNADMTTRLPIGDVVGALDPGIYALSAAVPGVDPYDDAGATQWFILSDIGLSTLMGNDGLTIVARGLGDAAALEGLEVQVISRANRVLGEATTDAMGVAHFAPGLMRGTGGAAPALVMASRGADDTAFLSLSDPAFDLSDRGVAGREPAGPIDTFLTTDRGAYRAGEVIHATALLRDGATRAVTGLPATAVLTRPDGVEHARIVSTNGVAGGHVFDLPLAPSVPRGTWQLAVFGDPKAPSLASTTLLVEDFVPERIDFDLALPDGPIDPLSPPLLEVAARYLFGAPGADLAIEGDMQLSPLDRLESLPGYRFGRHDERGDPVFRTLPGDLRTDAEGLARLTLPLGDAGAPGQPVEARVTLRLSEGSGRPVERTIARPLAPTTPMIGIRPLFDDTLPEGSEARFALQAVGPNLNPVPMQVNWTINRVNIRYQWYQQYGNWNWEPVTTRSTIARGTATLGDEPVIAAADIDWGRYEIVVERTDGAYVASSTGFDAGWYAPANAAQTPDMLDLSLDADRYAPGDTAQLRIVPRHAGTAVITVLSDRVIAMQTVTVPAGETTLDLHVTDEWGAGVYVTAQVIRPMDVTTGQGPGRALGLAHAGVEPGAKLLNVRLETQADIAPRGPLTASIQIDGAADAAAYVTLAAVDLGILNLTGFQSPDPESHYFGQRRLGVEMRDIYGRLIDGMTGAMGTIRSGGDAGAQMRLQSPPPTEDLVAFFQGPVQVDANGRAEVTFEMPDFNGTVRLMAVAWTDSAIGAANADVLVRDPVVISASLPRFLAPGDDSRLLLDLTHASGPTGRMILKVEGDGVTLDTATLPAQFDLAVGETQRLQLPLRADSVGDQTLRIALTTPDGQTLTKVLTLGVRANDPAISVTRRFSLAPGQTFGLNRDVLAGVRPDSASVLMSAGPLARFDVPGLMAALDRYPYGCTEQVTSQALPLLYLSSIAEPLGLGNSARIATRIDQAVTRILTRQSGNGSFGLWSAGSGDFWLDAYVTDFLSRAQAQGHSIPERAYQSALDNLANRVAYAPDFDTGGEDIAYALMVLARAGRASMGDLRYYADEKRDAFATPLAAAQLGAALASYGDQTRADRMFARAASLIGGTPPDRVWRADYGSALRDTAGVLSLAIESGSSAVDRAALGARITGATGAMSTQEQAWALMAAQAMVADPTISGLSVDGTPVRGPFVRRIAGTALSPMAISNTSDTATDITLTTLGVPAGATEAGGYGYAITRDYYTMDGTLVNGDVAAGDRLVTVLTVRPADDTRARLMINDALPAGLEIDNPNLLRAGDLSALDWLSPSETEHVEFRSDRFLAAVDQRGADPIQLAYIVRAVSPGQFHHPAALVEDMYRPEYRANTASGQLGVTQ